MGERRMGYLEVICGSMFSGKSEELIRRVRRVMIAKKRVAVFKPSIDNRYSAQKVNSHDGNSLEAQLIEVDHCTGIPDIVQSMDADVVAIDEAQFFGNEIVEAVRILIESNKRVIIAGLDLDFAGRPFGPMPVLMALADDVQKLKAICVKCGEPAFYTQRLIDGRPASAHDALIVIGGKESYEARCRACHEVAPGDL
jgi:thymidine kinase